MRRRHAECIRHRARPRAADGHALEHEAFAHGEALHRIAHDANECVVFGKLRHGRLLIHQELLRRLMALRLRLKAGQIDTPLAPQKVTDAPAHAVYGIETERRPVVRVIAFHRLDQPDRSLLHRIHRRRQGAVRIYLAKDQRLIGLDDAAACRHVAILLIRTPERMLLLRREFLHTGELFHIGGKHGHTSFARTESAPPCR